MITAAKIRNFLVSGFKFQVSRLVVETQNFCVSTGPPYNEKGEPFRIPLDYQLSINNYFLTNVFVTSPSSVVTRTKYMPLARPETLMRVGLSITFTVLMSLP